MPLNTNASRVRKDNNLTVLRSENKSYNSKRNSFTTSSNKTAKLSTQSTAQLKKNSKTIKESYEEFEDFSEIAQDETSLKQIAVKHNRSEKNIDESIAEMKKKRTPPEEEKKSAITKMLSKIWKTATQTAQDTIPFVSCYDNGIIEVTPGYFTKSYQLEDVNFRVATKEDQEEIFKRYEGFINSFDSNTRIEITINNRNIDEKTLRQELMCAYRNDGLDKYRRELNKLISDRMAEGKNNLVSDKYLTVGIKADDIREATAAFKTRIDKEVEKQMRIMLGRQTAKIPPQTIERRVKTLHDIYNIGSESNLPEEYYLNDYINQGLGIKDIIAPTSFKFSDTSFQLGDVYACTMYCRTLPTRLSTDFMAELSDMPFNLTASIHFEPIEKGTAVELVKRHLVTINGNVIEAQERASKNGYSAELISPQLKNAQQQGEYLMDDINLNNQSLFYITLVVTHYADTPEKLKEDSKMLAALGKRYSCGLNKLNYQQEMGFTTSLPLAYNKLFVKILAKTESAALFIPFNSQEIMQKDGVYYGLNALSRNLLVLNRASKQAKNPNAIILGQSGAGKSVTAKAEILNVLLTMDSNNQVFVIDPEAEYVTMANALKEIGSAVVHIEAGSKYFLNPLDMDIAYGEDSDGGGSDPIVMKSDYICSLCEIAMSSRYGLTNRQRSLIDRCVRELYKPYMRHMQNVPKGVTIDTKASPTLDALYELLLAQNDPEADEVAGALEMYAKGSFDCFARISNVDVNQRFVVYDVKNISGTVKELGLHICLNHIWNQTIANKKKGIRTWIYIDEFHLIAKSEAASEFAKQIWKRARKWNGVPCAITQNLEDMIKTESSRAIINNSEFVIMLAQSPADRAGLKNLFNISDTQLTYITNSPSGQGLIYNGQAIIPFENTLPENTETFKLLTTKPEQK